MTLFLILAKGRYSLKFQRNILGETIKSSAKFIIIFLILLAIDIVVFYYTKKLDDSIYDKLMSYIKIGDIPKISLVSLLNFIVFLYIFVYYFVYERLHSFENIALRFSSKRYFVSKIIVASIIIVSFSVAYFIFLSFFFKNNIYDLWVNFIPYILYYYMLMLCIFILLDSNSYFILKVVSVLIFIMFSAHFHIIYVLIFIAIILLYELLTFDLRTLNDK